MPAVLPAKVLIHKRAYLLALSLLLIGLPFSKFLISISYFILIGNWLIEGNIKNKINCFLQNKIALAITSLFFIHIIGLLYTTDFSYGLGDIKKKIPLLIIPLIVSTSPKLSFTEIKKLLTIFVSAVFINTLITTVVILGLTDKVVMDVRDASLFVSHIRFALMVCLSFFIILYFAAKEKLITKISMYVFAIWLLLFLIITESITGLFIIGVVLYLLLLYLTIKEKNRILKFTSLTLLLILPVLSVLYLKKEVKDYYDYKVTSSEILSVNGEVYFHDTLRKDYENGYLVWSNIAWNELETGWNSRSKLKFDSADLKGNELKYTLLRYLTSKGLKKDSEALSTLSDKEIAAIEQGIPNVNYGSMFSVNDRVHAIIYEGDNYIQNKNPNGHSITMRFEFWKTAIAIIKKNILFGVGTGDVKQAFTDQYAQMNSPLEERWRLRAHNQFLEIGVGLGIVGIFVFLFSLLYPLYKFRNRINYFYAVFFLIAVLSMLTEDTIETQAGVAFFAVFNSLFLFSEYNHRSDVSTPLNMTSIYHSEDPRHPELVSGSVQ